ncbi:MAG: hypothetical protein ACLFQP_04555, partial [Halothece sp.]
PASSKSLRLSPTKTTAEAQTKTQRLAFWNQANPCYPWDFRRGNCAASAPVAPTNESSRNCDPSYPDVCIPPYPPDLDCGEISHRRFQVVGHLPQPENDGDGDGIGCES